MEGKKCNWTLDLTVRSRLSIREARLVTREQFNVISGKNGCGKSQLFTIIHSYKHSDSDNFLVDQGYRTYFDKAKSLVRVLGTERIVYIHPSRVIGKDPDEKKAGPYPFADLEAPYDFSKRYRRFRYSISRLAFEAHHYGRSDNKDINAAMQSKRSALLNDIISIFSDLFPGLSLFVEVNSEKKNVSVLARMRGMKFIRPQDPKFTDVLNIPFATLSDGEMNALFILYEILFHSHSAPTPILFLIDELENHMHPELQIKFIDILLSKMPTNAMLLATTHSPYIVSHVLPESRIYMVHSSAKNRKGEHFENQLIVAGCDGNISKILYDLYGARSRTVASSLLGDFHSIASVEAISFAEQCLKHPNVITESSPSDPQRTFLAGFIHTLFLGKQEVRILDIGAGNGRLIRALQSDIGDTTSVNVYFDMIEKDDDCKNTLIELKQKPSNNIKIDNIFESIEFVSIDKKYDIVLMHNVIHELDFKSFHTILGKMINLLKPNGIVNILEQMILPKGESRFFVFSSNSLTNLFSKIGYSTFVSNRFSRSGIPLYEITAKPAETRSVTASDDTNALLRAAVNETIKEDVVAYRHSLTETKNPLEIAFYAMNIANGSLYIAG